MKNQWNVLGKKFFAAAVFLAVVNVLSAADAAAMSEAPKNCRWDPGTREHGYWDGHGCMHCWADQTLEQCKKNTFARAAREQQLGADRFSNGGKNRASGQGWCPSNTHGESDVTGTSYGCVPDRR